jgi:hypothetical protein
VEGSLLATGVMEEARGRQRAVWVRGGECPLDRHRGGVGQAERPWGREQAHGWR